VQALEVVVPLRDLRLDLRAAQRVRHHAQLQLRHVLQLLILKRQQLELGRSSQGACF
jgi:hypothetical protein